MLSAECFVTTCSAATLILNERVNTLRSTRVPMADTIQNENQYIDAFLKLTLRPTSTADVFPLLTRLTPKQRQKFVDLADSNHVMVRAFEIINRVANNRGNDQMQA